MLYRMSKEKKRGNLIKKLCNFLTEEREFIKKLFFFWLADYFKRNEREWVRTLRLLKKFMNIARYELLDLSLFWFLEMNGTCEQEISAVVWCH